MNSEIYQWLVETEEAILRMILGMYRMITVQLWLEIYRFAVDTLGPVIVRLSRVVGLGCLWLIIVFAPLLLRLPLWLDLIWVSVAIGGSLWGLQRIVAKNEVTVELVDDD